MPKKILIGGLVVILAFLYLFKSPVAAWLLRSEIITGHVFGVMMSCIFNPVREVTRNIDNSNYLILLPDGTAKLNETEYLTSTIRMESYIKHKLAPLGWNDSEQQGAMFLVRRSDTGAQFGISLSPFTGAYYRFHFWTAEKPARLNGL